MFFVMLLLLVIKKTRSFPLFNNAAPACFHHWRCGCRKTWLWQILVGYFTWGGVVFRDGGSGILCSFLNFRVSFGLVSNPCIYPAVAISPPVIFFYYGVRLVKIYISSCRSKGDMIWLFPRFKKINGKIQCQREISTGYNWIIFLSLEDNFLFHLGSTTLLRALTVYLPISMDPRPLSNVWERTQIAPPLV